MLPTLKIFLTKTTINGYFQARVGNVGNVFLCLELFVGGGILVMLVLFGLLGVLNA